MMAMHGLLRECCVVTAGPQGVLLLSRTIATLSFDVLVEVQILMQSSHNYFYYKYLQLCIMILMFAHLRVMLGKESIFQFKVYGSVSYPRHYCNIYGHTKASTEHKRIDLDHSISIIIDIIVLPWIRKGREYG